MYKQGFMSYQMCRTFIAEYRSGTTYQQEIKDLLNYRETKLTQEQGVGIRREHRAYGGMVKKYPSRRIIISTPKQDQKGIDIFTLLKSNDNDIRYFAVSGPADKEDKEGCDYKVVVTDRKIWLLKQKHK